MATIYYFAPTPDFPSGGVQVIYRHVELLNKAGIPAKVLHRANYLKKKYAYPWYSADVDIRYFYRYQRSPLSEDDILVIPEMELNKVSRFKHDRYVVFIQNCYYTFGESNSIETVKEFYQNAERTLVVSEDSANYVQLLDETLPIGRVYLSIDETLFTYTGEKKLQIAYMSRKCPEDIHQVVELARHHPALAKFSFVDIHQVPLQKVAKIMRESLIYLSTSSREGFGLPPAEAMACGCLVVGYHGQGGKEFMNPECSFPIEQGNVQGFVRKVVALGEVLSHDAAHFDAIRASAAQQIANRYHPSREKESLLEFWRQRMP